MISHKTRKIMMFKNVGVFLLTVLSLCMILGSVSFSEEQKPIVINSEEESLSSRMERKITLDVRDMNIVDVIKFLALKGEFNVVISPTVEGRVTVFLSSVSIKDALDIVIISNHLAYKIQNNIIQVMSSVEYEAMFGKKFSDKTEVSIVRLNYVKPTYALAALDNVKSNVGKIIVDEDTGSVVMIDTPEAIANMKKALSEIEKPLETVIYTLQYAKAEDVAQKLRLKIDAKAVGAITPDERTNRIIVRAYPDRVKEVEMIVKELDSQTKAVFINARILQIVLKPQYDMGIDWQLDFRDAKDNELQKVSFQNLPSNFSGLNSSEALGSKFGQIAIGDFDVDAFEMKIRTLEQVSDTKILSNPQLLVTDRDEARIHVGDTIPYIISTTSGTGDNAITSEDVRFVDVGLKLNVTPTINDDGFITMKLRPEISTVVAEVEAQSGGIPQVNKTEVETSVIVKDKNTIILGGLKKDDKVHAKKGLPVLMDLPVFGPLFGRTSDTFTNTEIVIFITPRIVTGSDDYTATKPGLKPFKSYSTR